MIASYRSPLFEIVQLTLNATPRDTSCKLSPTIVSSLTLAITNLSTVYHTSFRLYHSFHNPTVFFLIGSCGNSRGPQSVLSSPLATDFTKAIEEIFSITRRSQVNADIEQIGWSQMIAESEKCLPSLLLREWKATSAHASASTNHNTIDTHEDREGHTKIWLSQPGVAAGWVLNDQVHADSKQQNEDAGNAQRRSRFALSIIGHHEPTPELPIEGIREVQREILEYVLG